MIPCSRSLSRTLALQYFAIAARPHGSPPLIVLDLTLTCPILTSMLRRRSDSSYILITQAEHARAASLVAAAIGGHFQPASRPADLADAVCLYASGFADLDSHPPLCAAGRPASFDELALPTLLDAYSTSAEAAAAHSPYAGMMLSLFCLQSSASLAANAKSIRDNFHINKVQQRQVELQEQLRPQLQLRNDLPVRYGLPEPGHSLTDPEAAFYYDFRLMLLSISLSLEVCSRRAVVGHLSPTPPAPRQASLPIAYHVISPAHCTLDPFPLAKTLPLTITGRRVPATIYDHPTELSEALAQSEPVHLETLIAAS